MCVSERMLVSVLSVSMHPHKISWAEAALAFLCGDLKPEDLLRSLGAWPDLD